MSILSVPGLSEAVQPSPLTTSFPVVDTFTIASKTMPGKWTLVDAPKVFGWQIQQGYGMSGAYIFPKGDELVVAKFHGEIWRQSDWLEFSTIRKVLLQKPVFTVGGTLTSQALGIDHPELKALGVDAVVVGKVYAAKQEQGGLWTVDVDFIQFRPPVIAPPPPKTKIPDVPAPQPTAQDNYDREQQANAARIASLQGL